MGIALNITVFNITGALGNGVFSASNTTPPTTSWINYPSTETQRANAGVLPAASVSGNATIYVQVNQVAGQVDFVVDVFGYYSTQAVTNQEFLVTTNASTAAIHGRSTTAGGNAIWGEATGGTGTSWGVRGTSSSSAPGAAGVFGQGPTGLPPNPYANFTGVAGIFGVDKNNYGVVGLSSNVSGKFVNQDATSGTLVSAAYLGETLKAGRFFGDVSVNNQGSMMGNLSVVGSISKGSGTFKIDHPLDPENKYLYHSFVESPDMMNVYNGNVILDARGRAIVELPTYFETLNKDFRYQLTCIGRCLTPPYIAEEVAGDRFQIAGGQPFAKISWQVTGIRRDPFANANRVIPEVEKEPEMKGYYLHPAEYKQPPEKGITERGLAMERERAARQTNEY